MCLVEVTIKKGEIGRIEWLYLLRSAKLCALWTAQAFICANCLAPVLRRASPKQKIAESEFPVQSHL